MGTESKGQEPFQFCDHYQHDHDHDHNNYKEDEPQSNDQTCVSFYQHHHHG